MEQKGGAVPVSGRGGHAGRSLKALGEEDSSAVAEGHLTSECKTDAGAGGLGGEVGLEDVGADVRRHALALIGDSEPPFIVPGFGLDEDGGAGRGGIDGVVDEDGERVLEVSRVEDGAVWRAGGVEGEADPPALGGWSAGLDDGSEPGGDFLIVGLDAQGRRGGEEVGHPGLDSIHGADDSALVVREFLARIDFMGGEFGE